MIAATVASWTGMAFGMAQSFPYVDQLKAYPKLEINFLDELCIERERRRKERRKYMC